MRVVKNVGLDFNDAPLVSVSPAGVLAYVPSGTGTSRLVWVSREGAEQPPESGTSRNSIGPDGDTLTFTRQDGKTSSDVYVASLMGRSPPRPVVRTPAYEGGAQLSPDGRWLAYASNESGRFQVYVRPFDESQRRFAVSSDGGSYALWRRDGRELFYRNSNIQAPAER